MFHENQGRMVNEEELVLWGMRPCTISVFEAVIQRLVKTQERNDFPRNDFISPGECGAWNLNSVKKVLDLLQ